MIILCILQCVRCSFLPLLPHNGAAKPFWRPWSDGDFGASTIKKASKLCQRHPLCCWLLKGTIDCFLKQWSPWIAEVLQVFPWFHLTDLARERHFNHRKNWTRWDCSRFSQSIWSNLQIWYTVAYEIMSHNCILRRYRILLITEPPAVGLYFIFTSLYYFTLYCTHLSNENLTVYIFTLLRLL